jgi:hypothetical protein
MGATYTRQSSYTDGDTITAAHTNDEFNQILAAFAAGTGHTHDGTTAEGGPITKLVSNSLTFGAGTAGTDITITFDGETTDGVLKWMEDEDYFEFSDDILIATTEKIQFRDTAIYIYSSADGQLDLVADTEIQIAATTVDINGAVDISGNLGVGGNLTVTGTTTFNGGTITIGDAATDNVVFGADVDSSIIPDDDNTYDLGSASQEWRDIYIDGTAYLDAINFDGTAITATAAELNLLDGVSGLVQADFTKLAAVDSTAAELNIVDGGTAASSVTVVDADRVVLNDDGTMKQVAVTDLAAYFDDEITAMPNLVSTGALNSGSITSGFTSIDVGSGAITTTGTMTYGSLSDGSITITAFVDEDDMASDSATLLPTQQSVKAYVDAAQAAVTTSFQLEDDDGTEVAITNAKEIKFIGSGLTTNWTDVSTGSDADPYDLTFTVDAAQTGITSLLATDIKIGEDDQTKIDFETADEIHFYAANVEQVYVGDNIFGPQSDSDVDLGSTGVRWKDAFVDSITVTGEIDGASLDISGDADIDGTLEADAMTLNGTAITTVATLSTGISNGNLAVFTSGAADNDFLRIDGTSIEGRSASEVLSDIGATSATDAANEATALAIALG